MKKGPVIMKLYCTMCSAFTEHSLSMTNPEIQCTCTNMRHGDKSVEYEHPIFTVAEVMAAKQEVMRLKTIYGAALDDDSVLDDLEEVVKLALHKRREDEGAPREELYEKRASAESFSKMCGHTVKFPRVPQDELHKLMEEHNRVNQPPTPPGQLGVGIRYNDPGSE